jgi:hypothetical protein
MSSLSATLRADVASDRYRGGAASTRALRETAVPEPDAVLSPFHLARLRLTQPEYAALAQTQARPSRSAKSNTMTRHPSRGFALF